MYKLRLLTNDASFIIENQTDALPDGEYIKAKHAERGEVYYIRREEIRYYRAFNIDNNKDDKQKENN